MAGLFSWKWNYNAKQARVGLIYSCSARLISFWNLEFVLKWGSLQHEKFFDCLIPQLIKEDMVVWEIDEFQSFCNELLFCVIQAPITARLQSQCAKHCLHLTKVSMKTNKKISFPDYILLTMCAHIKVTDIYVCHNYQQSIQTCILSIVII